jgi:hypothetical protein
MIAALTAMAGFTGEIGAAAAFLALAGDLEAAVLGATDLLFFIISFIRGMGLARLLSFSPFFSATEARWSAMSFSGPRQFVTDMDTWDTELEAAVWLRLGGT